MNSRITKHIKMIYSNVQGFTGKKQSISEILSVLDCDICFFAETLTTNVKISGWKSITPSKSVGQNVAILLSQKMAGIPCMKLYEPNDIVNMMGIRLEVTKNNFKRLYTGHFKQLSANDREDVRNQLFELRDQFREAALCKEGMIILCDSNVHVGGEGIEGCDDTQDWAGKELLDMIHEEGLYLVNNNEICHGIVTRVDPRNGTKSSIDLVICNEYMVEQIENMLIDVDGKYRPTKYTKRKITQTDHLSIIVDMKVNKIASIQAAPYRNSRDEGGKAVFVKKIQNTRFDDLFEQNHDIDNDFQCLMKRWNVAFNQSFDLIKPSNKRIKGVDQEVKLLLARERSIKSSTKEADVKEKELKEIQNKISTMIAKNLSNEMQEKIHKLSEASCPHAEVFKIRRNNKRSVNLDFPLKDVKGHIRVTRDGVDEVISHHFQKVFEQNPVPENWEEYWNCIDDIYELISYKESSDIKQGPTEKEIDDIINQLDGTKAVYGNMKIDLVKACGEGIRKVIHKCIVACFQSCQLPDEFKIEKMILLYKNKGKLDELDNYRGIFLRLIIVSIYQKWLYSKCSGIADDHGTESALGGRKGKSGSEALLVVKLLQDYAVWTKQQMIFKFLDVEKFFDSMNYKRCLIDIFNSGVQGQYWKAYQCLNKQKKCTPYIPSGKCSSIDIENVFVQGSSDAGLMAWNHMDSFNKKEKDIFHKICIVFGIDIDSLTFVDDMFVICKKMIDVITSSACIEVFQSETRLRFKPPKCKLMVMNEKEEIADSIGRVFLEKVLLHIYLGTIISKNGKRNEEISSKIAAARSVSNELVQILKSTDLSVMRLMFVDMLVKSCLDSTIKYGCAVWNKLNIGQSKEVNLIKVNLIKRVLELPFSTPSIAVQYDFGIVDLDLEVIMEKVLLYCEMAHKPETSIGRRLLQAMLKARVPGFCTELIDALKLLGLCEDDVEKHEPEVVRKMCKKKLVLIQEERLLQLMMAASKTDELLLNNFAFDGSLKEYLRLLPFQQARVIFMVRSRMFPVKENFKGRWDSQVCHFCHHLENVKHLFACPGYYDLLHGFKYDDLITLKLNIDQISEFADRLLLAKDRLEVFNV